MKPKEKELLNRATQALGSIPKQNNAMSARGATQYNDEMREALGFFRFMVYAWLSDEMEEVEYYCDKLEKFSEQCIAKAMKGE